MRTRLEYYQISQQVKRQIARSHLTSVANVSPIVFMRRDGNLRSKYHLGSGEQSDEAGALSKIKGHSRRNEEAQEGPTLTD
ncbi:hypothetical protein J4E86_001901 [Alternaria arbusti]|uniref:uncharacterized protein n=1 Tax=Alternaria arbusti TaxID=232088 RepID=UPI00221F9817|nr:uncharacterized protein J4E86_001901 [Alternaria arbusti]KAI4960279.1 hypothetical protein J4E86_001901 [Alternaria arbusti]